MTMARGDDGGRWAPWLLALALTLVGCAAARQMIQEAFRTGELVGGDQTGIWTYRYPSGALLARGEYRRDEQHGPWTYWHESGEVEWQGAFEDARLHGPSLFYWEDGTLRAQGEFLRGFEEGRWSFFGRDGRMTMQGDFVGGRRGLRWIHFHPNGQVAAEGYRHQGEKVGLWRYWSTDGTEYQDRHPFPEDWGLVLETWPDGTPKREGFAVDGGPIGRWATYHANAERRALGDFKNGRIDGLVTFWKADGDPLARGEIRTDVFTGPWTVWENGVPREVRGSAWKEPERWYDGEFSADDLPARTPVGEVATQWAAELGARVEGLYTDAGGSAPAPPPALVERSNEPAIVPLRPQPWTDSELRNLDFLVTLYRKGAEAAQPPAGSRYGGGRRRGRKTTKGYPVAGDTERARLWLDRRLPDRTFKTGDGADRSLEDFRGQPVLLVLLRGFVGEVCVYCTTQTKALSLDIDEFEARGVEVLVVYPGEANRLDAFLAGFRDLPITEGVDEPPFEMLYDPGAEFVRELGFIDELAVPATFLLDADGVVRYAYVARTQSDGSVDIVDRPSTPDLLNAIDQMLAP